MEVLSVHKEFRENEEFLDTLAMCAGDTKLFCLKFFPDTFYLEFSPEHDKIFDLLDNSDNPKKVIQAPRGMGKTSILKAYAVKNVVYRFGHFTTFTSKAEKHSMMQTEHIKNMLRSKLIRGIFGDIRLTKAGKVEEFTKLSWIAFGDHIVVPRGCFQQHRGLNWNDFRPDLMIFDDVEDDETIDNDEQRAKLKRIFKSSHINAVPQTNSNWEIIYIDTLKHEDSLLAELLESPDWDKVNLSLCDDNFKTLMPTFKSQADLDKMVKSYEQTNDMDIFAREFMGKPISKKHAAFRQDMFKYYSETDKDFVNKVAEGKIINVVIGDPAKTANMSNAESGIVVWGIDVEEHKMYFRLGIGAHFHPDEFYQQCIDLCVRYRASLLGVESTGLSEYIEHPIKNYIAKRGLRIHPVFLRARRGQGEFAGVGGGKRARIAGLIPYYEQGVIFHNEHEAARRPYELQLLSFPKSKRWDIMDAAAYIIELMEREFIYFNSPPEEMLEERDVEESFNPYADNFDYGVLEEEPIEGLGLI